MESMLARKVGLLNSSRGDADQISFSSRLACSLGLAVSCLLWLWPESTPPREREILQLVAERKLNKEIATALNLSPYTVETRRRNFQEKLNLHSLAELILYAVRKGIVS